MSMENPQHNLNEDADKTKYHCAHCDQPENDELQMVFCDHCQNGYHYSCVDGPTTENDDEEWMCPLCRKSDTDHPDPEDEEIAAAIKAVELERERQRNRQAQKLKLAQMQMELEKEKLEMQWDTEKKILEMKIKAETDFIRNHKAERKELQKELKKLTKQRLRKEKSANKSGTVGKKEETSNPTEFRDGNVSNSTPILQAGASETQIRKKKFKQGSVVFGEKSKTSVGENSSFEAESEDGSSAELSDDSSSTESSENSSSTESESEEKGSKKKKSVRAGPKAQMTARQFLSRKLPTFTGRPEEWPIFISSYQTSTIACGFSNLENLARLQECLKGAARDAVSSRLLLPDAVPQVMETLRMLYGRPEQLLNTLLMKVRKADPPKSDKLSSFITYGVLVQQLCDHLEASKLMDHLVNPMLIRELVDKLPASTKIYWVRYKRQVTSVTLRTLADFLSDLVSAASEVVNYSEMSPQVSGGKTGKPKSNKGKEQESYVYTHSGSEVAAQNKKPERTPCAMCGETNHRLRNCDNFRKLSVPQRWEAVNKWELCPICLNAHGKAKCKLNIRCTAEGCSERHNRLLHPAEFQSSCNTHSALSKDSILFRMVPAMSFADVAGKYRHLEGLPVTDYAASAPLLLIGLKHIELFAPLESRVGQPGEPIAVRSKLGWTIYGPQDSTQGEGFLAQHSCAGLSNAELHDLLKSQYTVEEKGFSADLMPESDDDRKAREMLEEKTVRVGDRFMTGLLFKEDNPTFPDSLPMALRRMKSLEKKMSKTLSYCHRATKEELASVIPGKVWYLPLNVVVNPKKDKVRLVLDAAAEVNGVSLNSKLLKGPDYLASLPSVIAKSREFLNGFGGDIREMFHQLKVRPEDRLAQLFVFGNEIYVMDCVIFGATCSPSMAMFVKDKNARDYAEQFPEAYDAIVHKHYVDDYFDSTNTVEKAVQRASEVRFVHSKGGFEIRGWVSNSLEFLERMGETEKKQAIHLDSANPERVLGIVWNTKDDVFAFTTKMRDSLMPYLYDPYETRSA
ncbi:uncharacterized protein LOC129728642 [Wyeomyia smithii]|uniref:uncharacterized protein LOC129728642 n=1 Tax=Wyeomyia smithii TaxID=174621 RepID=UPI002468002F|nr:uncharacterized protein LOC129728642 [Wyeomyia smithii]